MEEELILIKPSLEYEKQANDLIDKLTGRHTELKEFTDKYLKKFLEQD